MSRSAALWGVGVLAALCLCLIPNWTRDPDQTLRFMMWGTPEEIRVVQGFLREFEQQHPEIHVKVEAAPAFGYTEKLRLQFIGGSAPDVMYVKQENLEAYAGREWLLPLDERIERDKAEVDPEDFYPQIFDRFQYRGKRYGIGKDFATLVVYYNRDLFDAWDVPYPKAGWTWDDFLATSKALSKGDTYGFLVETWAEELFPWIWQAGGDVARVGPNGPEWVMGKPEFLDGSAEGLQFLADLIWKHKVAPSPSVTRDLGGNAPFTKGRVAMCTYGRWASMEFRRIKDFEWDVVELPRHKQRATSTFAVAYGIANNSRQPDKAWTLVKFLTSKQNQLAVAHSVQAIPSRRSAATSDAFLRPDGFKHLPAPIAATPHTDQVPVGRFSPRFKTANEAKNRFKELVEPLWNGTRRDAKALLREIQPTMEAITRGEIGR